MKSLLCAVLVVELGCWSSTSTQDSTAPTTQAPPRSAPTCTEHGDRLKIVACRDGNNVAWTITNVSNTPLWAFVAPPTGSTGEFDRANAAARIESGRVVLTKIVFPPIEGERVFTAAVPLAPGESDHGVIPLGQQLNTRAKNLTRVQVIGATSVTSVELEIGFAEQRPKDDPHPVKNREPLVLLLGFDRKRQEIARAPAVPWR